MDTVLKDLNPVIQLLIVMTLFSLLPFVFACLTSFLRFIIVFSILKTALGTQQVPPGIVIIGLSVILTFYTMGPVFQKMYEVGSVPYQKSGDMFMLKQTREADLEFFVSKSRVEPPESPDDLTIFEVAPAFILSELKTSFEIGFIIFIPFIVLDIVVANVLLALGMFMLSPTIISLPFKLLIFIAVDGWSLIVSGLVSSFN